VADTRMLSRLTSGGTSFLTRARCLERWCWRATWSCWHTRTTTRHELPWYWHCH
jgi:hypothetical protein